MADAVSRGNDDLFLSCLQTADLVPAVVPDTLSPSGQCSTGLDVSEFVPVVYELFVAGRAASTLKLTMTASGQRRYARFL